MSDLKRRLLDSLVRHGVAEPERILSEVLQPTQTWHGDTIAPVDDDPLPAGAVATDDAFELLHELGRGGMGVVYRALDGALSRHVAVKVLRPQFEGKSQFRSFFEHEARVTAGLTHPGIVPIHSVGTLSDGRPFYAMQEIDGQTLTDLIFDAYEAGEVDAVVRRRLVDAVLRAAQAVGFAHDKGMVHRDIKPDNILIGAHGEVRVVDWGLAAPTGTAAKVAGTPGFMSAEQNRGELVAPAADVHGLGATLWLATHGTYAWDPRVTDAAAAVKSEAPRPMPSTGDVGLDRILVDSLTFRPEDRICDANAFADRVQNWLEGADARRRAEELRQKGEALFERWNDLLHHADNEASQGQELLREAGARSPVEAKRPGWAFEDSAARLLSEAALVEEEAVQTLLASLRAAELPQTHARLAEHWTSRLFDAESRRDETEVKRLELRLRRHLPPDHPGPPTTGTITLQTHPSNASLTAYRLEEVDRVLRRCANGVDLGTGRVIGAELAAGSWVLEATAPGYHPASLSVRVERGKRVRMEPPDGRPAVLRLLPAGALAEGEVYVPEGWLIPGGDSDAPLQLPSDPVWVGSMVWRQFVVTAAEYAAYLDELEGAGIDPLGRAPLHGDDGYVSIRAGGRHRLKRMGVDDSDRLPVTYVGYREAKAYAEWTARRSGQPWRLPFEVEWERAARGGDGRTYVWGNRFDPSFCNMMMSMEKASVCPVDAFEIDTSPYGVRGMAGNVWEWTGTPWATEGPYASVRVLRGGAFNNSEIGNHAAYRGGGAPDERSGFVGFRLVRPV